MHGYRCIIADAAFSGYKLAVGLLEKGLFLIGNVKTCHSGFPKQKLQSLAPERDMVASAVTTAKLDDGQTHSILAVADRDKQPMSVIATAGTTLGPVHIHRRVRTIHKDGRAKVSDKTLTTVMASKKYRDNFNAIDKHNAKRQGRACLEDVWRTHRWVLRDYQALVGVSLINVLLSIRHFTRLDVPYWKFLRVLYTQLLENHLYLSRRRPRNSQGPKPALLHRMLSTKEHMGKIVQRMCVQCGKTKSMWFCPCKGHPQAGTAASRNYLDPCAFLCSPKQNPECFVRHMKGEPTYKLQASAEKAGTSHDVQ